MRERYRLFISNRSIYREIELTPQMQSFKLGTGIETDIRLQKELFFEEFELQFFFDNTWKLGCSDNIYISSDGSARLIVCELNHGTSVSVRYRSGDNELFRIECLIDFEYENKNYDREIDIGAVNTVKVGGTADCNIIIDDPYVGAGSVILERKGKERTITEVSTKYGLFVNGGRVSGTVGLAENDFFSIADYSFCYRDEKLYTDSNKDLKMNGLRAEIISKSKSKLDYPRFNRSTRIFFKPLEKTITILDPPEKEKPRENNIILSLLPTLAMLIVTILVRGLMGRGGAFILISICSMSVGLGTTIYSFFHGKKISKKREEQRVKTYSEYLRKKESEIKDAHEEELGILRKNNPSIDETMTHVSDFDGRLFERVYSDEDFCSIRVGSGSKDSAVEVTFNKQERISIDDQLLYWPAQIQEKTEKIDNAPTLIPLKGVTMTGVVGNRDKVDEFIKTALTDLSVYHFYKEVKLGLIVSGEEKEEWEWARWLRHMSDESGMRNIAYSKDTYTIMIENLYRTLTEREDSGAESNSGPKAYLPYYVVFIKDYYDIMTHPLSRFFTADVNYGVSFVFFADAEELLPRCERIIRLGTNTPEILEARDGGNGQSFTPDWINTEQAAEAAMKLSCVDVDEISLAGQLTSKITLFDLLGIYGTDDLDYKERWGRSEVYKTLAAPLGINAKNETVYLDLHEKAHGPHGLIAGTTGSGKSEIMQSYILSMAMSYHPYEVGFVIIDFKGGGMVNQFKNLPHLIGSITDIDGREINRSLLSIRAELNRRKELFAQAQVNRIDAYIRKYREGQVNVPLPHLILIVDEFAELKAEQPEFMKELISTARIGRSLGVHLILATQKPSGVVDAQIWSNSRFRLCLKVATPEDSKEMLKTTLAAEIREPGRAYLQVGNNEIFELFQSAYSGGPAESESTGRQKEYEISSVALNGERTVLYSYKPERKEENEETQLSVIVDSLNDYCEKNNIKRLPGICLPPLPDILSAKVSDRIKNPVRTMLNLGLYDDPERQSQNEYEIDITSSHMLIMGSAFSGKTCLLQQMIRCAADRYEPDDVNMYVIDFASKTLGMFVPLKHVGGVVYSDQEERLKTLIKMLVDEVKKRKELFASVGVTSFIGYREAKTGKLPNILLFIDNFVALRELYPNYDESLLFLLREGLSVGLSVVITALQSNGIGYKYMSNFSSYAVLYCNDSGEYGSVLDRCRIRPKNVPGRAVVNVEKEYFEMQTYLAFEGEKEIDRAENIREYISQINNEIHGQIARLIPEIPDNMSENWILENDPRTESISPYTVTIGMDYATIGFERLNLRTLSLLSICGPESADKSNVILGIVNSLQRYSGSEPVSCYVLDGYDRKLKGLESYDIVEHYTTDISEGTEMLKDVRMIAVERRKLFNAGEIEQIENAPLIVTIIRNQQFYPADKRRDDIFNGLYRSARELKLLFIIAEIENSMIGASSGNIMKAVKEARTMLYAGRMEELQALDLPTAVIRENKAELQSGDFFYIQGTGVKKIRVAKAKEIDKK